MEILTSSFIAEFELELTASRKCVERIPEKLFGFKPHPTSMAMEYLALLVAEIPLWISIMIEEGVVNFATYKHVQPKTTTEMVAWFDDCTNKGRKSLKSLKDEDLSRIFELRHGEQLLSSEPLSASIPSTLNHWVHHRGQLTVYMRMNSIAVPSIYGPSADEKG